MWEIPWPSLAARALAGHCLVHWCAYGKNHQAKEPAVISHVPEHVTTCKTLIVLIFQEKLFSSINDHEST